MTTYLGVPARPDQESPAPSQTCLDDLLCGQMYEWTGVGWLAEGSYYLLLKPLRIVLVVLLAVVARFLLHRMINRLVRTTANRPVPVVLRPLRERTPDTATAQSAVSLIPERRRQRAGAVGSVLRSAMTVVVSLVAALLIVDELGLNLAPLLASAGIIGIAFGLGAQALVKDLITGLFMLMEDQYGVGDTIDLGEVSGTVEAIGLRVTTVRDGQGVLWYVRNGEIVRVGNKSQGWAMAVVDMPIGLASVEEATAVLRRAAAGLADDPEFAPDFIEPPEVLGVEQITLEGTVVRVSAKTIERAQSRISREMRRRMAEALEEAGIGDRGAGRTAPRPAAPPQPDGEPAGTG